MLHLALTCTIDATAFVAESISAAAAHVVAALGAFDPVSAVRALLELLTLGEFVEGGVQFVDIVRHLVFLTCHSIVEGDLAAKTVVLFAYRAV